MKFLNSVPIAALIDLSLTRLAVAIASSYKALSSALPSSFLSVMRPVKLFLSCQLTIACIFLRRAADLIFKPGKLLKSLPTTLLTALLKRKSRLRDIAAATEAITSVSAIWSPLAKPTRSSMLIVVSLSIIPCSV